MVASISPSQSIKKRSEVQTSLKSIQLNKRVIELKKNKAKARQLTGCRVIWHEALDKA